MAVPTIRSTSSGTIDTDATYTHSITMPGTIVAGDLLVCCVSISPCAWGQVASGSSSNWNTGGFYTPVYGFTANFSQFFAVALGGGSDVLNIETFWSTLFGGWVGYSRVLWITDEFHRYTKIAYVCYAISGAKVDPPHSFVHFSVMPTAGSTAMWNFDACPPVDDSDVQDYLWMLSAAAETDNIATVAPSGFSGLITAQGQATGYYPCSISTCTMTSTVSSQVNPAAFNAPLCDWAGTLLRIVPAVGSDPVPIPPGSGGVGTYIYSDGIYTYTGIETVEVNPEDMYFGYQGDQCSNPFGTYIEIYATSSWTASWINDDHFDAGQYSGSAGVTYVAITCRAENTTGSSYVDTLTVVCGSGSDTITVEQYATGIGCP
jgi:hypothetical protein